MKQIISLIACLVLMAAVLPPARALGGMLQSGPQADWVLTADRTAVQPGEEITVTAELGPVQQSNAGGILLDLDPEVFDFLSGDVSPAAEGRYLVAAVNSDRNLRTGKTQIAGVYGGFREKAPQPDGRPFEEIGGKLFRFHFRVSDTAAPGVYVITGESAAKVNENSIPGSVKGVEIQVGSTGPGIPVTITRGPDSITARLTNQMGGKLRAQLVLAGYDADGRMTDFREKTASLAELDRMELTLPSGAVSTARAFVLDPETGEPLCEAKTA